MLLRGPRPAVEQHAARWFVAWIVALALALAGAARPARAAITPEARAVIDRFVAKAGGREAFDRTHAMAYLATITAFGLNGTVRVWTQEPDKRASDLKLGPFNLRDGYDGTRGWRTDPSGKLLALDGKDLEDAKASAWFENERWLAADQDGGNITLVGAEQDSGGTYDVLEVTPPVGRSRRLWFDRATGLHDRTVSRNDQNTTINRFSDWRPVSGRLFAYRSFQSVQGMSLNTLTIVVDSAWVNPAIPSAQFEPPADLANPVVWLKQPGVAHLPFEYLSDHVWLRASVNGGPPADFIYDTGASLTVLDSAYAASIGVAGEGRLQGQGAGSVGTGAFGRLQKLKVAAAGGDGIELADTRVAVLNLNAFLAPFFWKDAAGIIGFDVINRFVNEIDYDHHVLTLYDPKTFRYAGRGDSIPITIDGHVPVVRATLDGTYEGGFRLDVGSGSTVDLHAPFVAKHDLEKVVGRTIPVTGGGFGGTFTSRLGRMHSMRLGTYEWERPLVVLSGAGGGAFTSEDYAGNIGNGILHRFKVTLDYERRLMWLEPGKAYSEPDVFSRSGLQLMQINGAIQVGQVIAGSPGDKAGLQRLDTVLSVDGRDPKAMGNTAVTELLQRGAVGRKVKFEIERDGKRMKKTLTLADVM